MALTTQVMTTGRNLSHVSTNAVWSVTRNMAGALERLLRPLALRKRRVAAETLRAVSSSSSLAEGDGGRWQ